MGKQKKRPYVDVNVPREWQPFLDELLGKAEILKQLEMQRFSQTYSGLGCWIIREFLVEKTSYRFQHFNTFEDHVTIIDNKINRIIDIYCDRPPGELWCEYCEKTECEHISYATSIPEVVEVFKKKGWKE